MSTCANSPLRITCQINPRMRCSLPSAISVEPMFTTEHPIAFAEEMTILLFSVIWNAFNGFFPVALLRTRKSMVSGTESLMSLESTKPSLHSSKICMVSVGMGNREPISGSDSIIYVIDMRMLFQLGIR